MKIKYYVPVATGKILDYIKKHPGPVSKLYLGEVYPHYVLEFESGSRHHMEFLMKFGEHTGMSELRD